MEDGPITKLVQLWRAVHSAGAVGDAGRALFAEFGCFEHTPDALARLAREFDESDVLAAAEMLDRPAADFGL